ncbi:diphthine--ammonia ligase [Candidatus Woesearchaeota archaeon]|jgi:diphthine-ammonia ligase|nr:diphthine--ammonia ligase [Candidatus Woesearchaeota archaeon]
MKLAALFTGGKDSTYAIHLAQQAGNEITCLITIQSDNPDSYMFHTPAIELTELQAEAMEMPHIIASSEGEKEVELEDLELAIKVAKEKFEFEGVITGALFSEYQSSRIEKICLKLGLKCVNPLWHKNQEEEMQELVDQGFEFIFTAIAADGLNKNWLNKVIDNTDLLKLKELKDKIGSNVAGEGGEFESLVLDCPLFKKKLVIEEFEIQEESEYVARMIIKKAKLEDK